MCGGLFTLGTLNVEDTFGLRFGLYRHHVIEHFNVSKPTSGPTLLG